MNSPLFATEIKALLDRADRSGLTLKDVTVIGMDRLEGAIETIERAAHQGHSPYYVGNQAAAANASLLNGIRSAIETMIRELRQQLSQKEGGHQ